METFKFLLTSTFYPPYHLGGDAVHVKYLAEALVKTGHEAHVFHSLDAYRIKRKGRPEKAESDGVHTHVVKTRFNLSSYATYILGNSSSVIKKFERLTEDVKPDVVHHHNISLLGYGILKKRSDCLNLYTAHDYWLICQETNLFKNGSEICGEPSCFLCALRCGRLPQFWRLRKGFKETVRDIDIFIAPSNYIRKRISQDLDVKAVTIPNFVPEPVGSIESSGFSNFFLYAGVLEKHKGILSLINIYKEISGEVDARLLITGSGPLEDYIKEFVKRNELEGKIIPLGWVTRDFLYRLLNDANALIMPSIWAENCPLIALEALSVGTPVIASSNGGLPEILEKIHKGLLYKSSDELKEILANFDRKKYASQPRIKDIYKEYYSPIAYLKKYLELVTAR